jgi:hypothetical protein
MAGFNAASIAAGASAADPLLNGVKVELAVISDSRDVATITAVGIDQSASLTIDNDQKASLSPAHTVLTSGSTGSFTNSSKNFVINSTAGLAARDMFSVQVAGINSGNPFTCRIASITNGTTVVLESGSLLDGADRSNIAYQVCWRLLQVMGSAPSVSSAGGTQNYFAAAVQDSASNAVTQQADFYIRNAPAGYVTVNTLDVASVPTFNTLTLTLAVLATWTNRGGITHIALANHSVQGVNNFTWGDASTGEKTIGVATQSNGLLASAGSGAKYGRLLLRTFTGSVSSVGVDFSVNIDVTPPTISLQLTGTPQ